MARAGDCGNCGRWSDDLVEVQRVWVAPESTVDPDVEGWCVSCRTQYPHQPV